jgi:hypothetical protein
LEKLGFPWILSSESSLFNGLRGIFAERKFLAPFCRGGIDGWAQTVLGAEGQDNSWDKLTLVSDFLQ